MNLSILTYVGSLVVLVWGVAHLFPTQQVVEGFGDISDDNKRVITMEWIIEGVTLIFIGLLVAATTIVDGSSVTAKVVYWSVVAVLNALSVVSFFTGFRNSYIAFKLCPFIFTGSSILIFIGSLKY
jgi:hypothetical protein